MTRKKDKKKSIKYFYKINKEVKQENLTKINYKLEGHKIFTYEKVARQ